MKLGRVQINKGSSSLIGVFLQHQSHISWGKILLCSQIFNKAEGQQVEKFSCQRLVCCTYVGSLQAFHLSGFFFRLFLSWEGRLKGRMVLHLPLHSTYGCNSYSLADFKARSKGFLWSLPDVCRVQKFWATLQIFQAAIRELDGKVEQLSHELAPKLDFGMCKVRFQPLGYGTRHTFSNSYLKVAVAILTSRIQLTQSQRHYQDHAT